MVVQPLSAFLNGVVDDELHARSVAATAAAAARDGGEGGGAGEKKLQFGLAMHKAPKVSLKGHYIPHGSIYPGGKAWHGCLRGGRSWAEKGAGRGVLASAGGGADGAAKKDAKRRLRPWSATVRSTVRKEELYREDYTPPYKKRPATATVRGATPDTRPPAAFTYATPREAGGSHPSWVPPADAPQHPHSAHVKARPSTSKPRPQTASLVRPSHTDIERDYIHTSQASAPTSRAAAPDTCIRVPSGKVRPQSAKLQRPDYAAEDESFFDFLHGTAGGGDGAATATAAAPGTEGGGANGASNAGGCMGTEMQAPLPTSDRPAPEAPVTQEKAACLGDASVAPTPPTDAAALEPVSDEAQADARMKSDVGCSRAADADADAAVATARGRLRPSSVSAVRQAGVDEGESSPAAPQATTTLLDVPPPPLPPSGLSQEGTTRAEDEQLPGVTQKGRDDDDDDDDGALDLDALVFEDEDATPSPTSAASPVAAPAADANPSPTAPPVASEASPRGVLLDDVSLGGLCDEDGEEEAVAVRSPRAAEAAEPAAGVAVAGGPRGVDVSASPRAGGDDTDGGAAVAEQAAAQADSPAPPLSLPPSSLPAAPSDPPATPQPLHDTTPQTTATAMTGRTAPTTTTAVSHHTADDDVDERFLTPALGPFDSSNIGMGPAVDAMPQASGKVATRKATGRKAAAKRKSRGEVVSSGPADGEEPTPQLAGRTGAESLAGPAASSIVQLPRARAEDAVGGVQQQQQQHAAAASPCASSAPSRSASVSTAPSTRRVPPRHASTSQARRRQQEAGHVPVAVVNLTSMAGLIPQGDFTSGAKSTGAGLLVVPGAAGAGRMQRLAAAAAARHTPPGTASTDATPYAPADGDNFSSVSLPSAVAGTPWDPGAPRTDPAAVPRARLPEDDACPIPDDTDDKNADVDWWTPTKRAASPPSRRTPPPATPPPAFSEVFAVAPTLRTVGDYAKAAAAKRRKRRGDGPAGALRAGAERSSRRKTKSKSPLRAGVGTSPHRLRAGKPCALRKRSSATPYRDVEAQMAKSLAAGSDHPADDRSERFGVYKMAFAETLGALADDCHPCAKVLEEVKKGYESMLFHDFDTERGVLLNKLAVNESRIERLQGSLGRAVHEADSLEAQVAVQQATIELQEEQLTRGQAERERLLIEARRQTAAQRAAEADVAAAAAAAELQLQVTSHGTLGSPSALPTPSHAPSIASRTASHLVSMGASFSLPDGDVMSLPRTPNALGGQDSRRRTGPPDAQDLAATWLSVSVDAGIPLEQEDFASLEGASG